MRHATLQNKIRSDNNHSSTKTPPKNAFLGVFCGIIPLIDCRIICSAVSFTGQVKVTVSVLRGEGVIGGRDAPAVADFALAKHPRSVTKGAGGVAQFGSDRPGRVCGDAGRTEVVCEQEGESAVLACGDAGGSGEIVFGSHPIRFGDDDVAEIGPAGGEVGFLLGCQHSPALVSTHGSFRHIGSGVA